LFVGIFKATEEKSRIRIRNLVLRIFGSRSESVVKRPGSGTLRNLLPLNSLPKKGEYLICPSICQYTVTHTAILKTFLTFFYQIKEQKQLRYRCTVLGLSLHRACKDFDANLSVNTLHGDHLSTYRYRFLIESITVVLKYIFRLLFSAVLAGEILLVFVSVNSPEKREKTQLNWYNNVKMFVRKNSALSCFSEKHILLFYKNVEFPTNSHQP
jgi:hypothetical protein